MKVKLSFGDKKIVVKCKECDTKLAIPAAKAFQENVVVGCPKCHAETPIENKKSIEQLKAALTQQIQKKQQKH